jgi:membrane protein DedA with SNARE-associated domain
MGSGWRAGDILVKTRGCGEEVWDVKQRVNRENNIWSLKLIIIIIIIIIIIRRRRRRRRRRSKIS